MKAFSFLMFALAGLSTASACDCMRPESAGAQVAAAPVIFVGTARETVHSDEEGSPEGYTIFTVKETLKGAPQEEIYLFHTLSVDANCGIDFADGKDALVMAYEPGGDKPLWTNGCSMPQFPEAEIRAALKSSTKSAP